jgi:hypothetical protein
MMRLRNFSWPRFIAGLLFFAACAAILLQAPRLGSNVFTVFAGLVYGVILCSLGEWITHGILYHSEIPGLKFIHTIHHHGHHFTLFPTTKYTQVGKFEFMRFRKPLKPFRMSDNRVDNLMTIWSQNFVGMIMAIPLIFTPTFLLTPNWYFRGAVVAMTVFISCLMTYVHGVIHTPRGRWIERQKAFLWLDRHHYIHHIDITANVNFMLPLADLVFGTQKWESTPLELSRHPTFEQAKPMAYDVDPVLNQTYKKKYAGKALAAMASTIR